MRLTALRTLAPALLIASVASAALAGCSSTADNDASGDSGGSVAAEAPAAEATPADGNGPLDSLSLRDTARGSADTTSVVSTSAPDEPQRALIKKGNVALRAHDVGKAQFEVQRVVDAHGGQVSEEKTTTDDDGAPAYTRMVLRIPAAGFDKAMAELKGLEGAELDAADTSEDDVTTKLIDTRTRLAVQRRSIERITTLFDRAQSIRDIMAIEAQLSRRQADLDSLERQEAYLQSQTSRSTIVVSIDQIPAKKAAADKKDDTGFAAGLSAGWHGLTAFAVAMATVLGAVLPWTIVLLVLGIPALVVLRAARRRRTHPAPAPTEG